MTDLDRDLEQQFDETPIEDGGLEEPPVQPDPTDDTPTPPPDNSETAGDDLVEVPGVGRFTPRQLAEAARTAQWADRVSRENPQAWGRIVAWEQGGFDDTLLTPAQQPQAPVDDEDDYLDPKTKVALDRIAELEARIQAREQREARTNLDTASHQFRQSHPDITDQDMDEVWRFARERNLISSFIPHATDEIAGIRDALEAAYRYQHFDKAVDTGRRAQVQDIREKRRAAAVGGSARSTPRVEPEPKTPEARYQAMVDAIREAQQA